MSKTKVVVSGYAWIDVSGYELSKIAAIRNACTVKPRRTSRYDTSEKLQPIELFRVKESLLGVPREYFMKNRTVEHETEYRVSPGRPWSVRPNQDQKYKLRDDQPEALAATLERLKPPFGGGVIQAPTAWGKTVLAIEVARRLGVLTAVLIERNKVKTQWIKAVKEQLPEVRVGMIQEDRFDIDCDVIVCMTDSMKDREEEHQRLYEETGLVICDEVHHMGARTSSPLIGRFRGPYRIAFSAKPHRTDGCDRAFYDHIGPKAYKASVRRLTAKVVVRKTRWEPINVPSFNPEKVSDQTLINIMVMNLGRNEMIVEDIIKAITAGRKILVFSHRRGHLDTLREMIAGRRPNGKTIGFLRGGMSERDLAVSDKCDVMLATYDFCKEAYDNPDIDTVALTTPVGDPEQPVGRATRWKPEKKEPIVLDYADDGPSIFTSKFDRRLNVYRKIQAVIHGR